jgi:hypothetical protein
MNVVVNIYTPDMDTGSIITIEQIEGTNNYNYTVEWEHNNDSGSWTGTVYNYTGNYFELVKQVMNGRSLS